MSDPSLPHGRTHGWLLVHPDGVIAAADGGAATLLVLPGPTALVGASWENLVEREERSALRGIARSVRYGLGWSGTLRALTPRGPVTLQVEASGVGGAIALALSAHLEAVPPPAANAAPLPPPGAATLSEAPMATRATLEAAARLIDASWAVLLRAGGAGPALTILDCAPEPLAGLAPGVTWGAPDAAERAVIEGGEPALDGALAVRRGDVSPLAKLPAYGMRSALRVPLFDGASVVGLAVAYSTSPQAFTAEDAVRFEHAVRALGGAPKDPTAGRAPARSPEVDAPSTPSTPGGDRLRALADAMAGVAHELNNPLAAVVGYAQALRSLPPTEQQHALEVIETEALRAGGVVHDLLLFAQRQPPRLAPLDVSALVRRVVEAHRTELESGGIVLESDLPPLPEVRGDVAQLEEAMARLVDNARQAMPGGGSLRVRSVLVEPEGAHIRLTVEDTGRGVALEVRDRVFEPFFTTSDMSSGGGAGGGRGLGLAVVYGIVASHGGRIGVESSPEGGARFALELPVRTEPTRQSSARRPAEEAAASRRSRILVVDDEESLRSLTTQALEAFGYEAASAPSAEAAIELLETQPFDAVLSDIRMPGMDGVALHAEISRRWPALAGRVVIMTGDVENESVARLVRDGGLMALEKPFRLEALREAFAKVLGETPL